MLDRRKAVKSLLAQRGGDVLIVTGLGSPTYDVAAVADRADNFYLWSAMGGAVPMALGLALAQPGMRVLCVTGDGELLMGLGGLASVGVAQPRNLAIVVIDNEAYGETGGQKSHTAGRPDLAQIASACGFQRTVTARTESEMTELRNLVMGAEGPVLGVIKANAGEHERVLPSRDGHFLRQRFKQAVGGVP